MNVIDTPESRTFQVTKDSDQKVWVRVRKATRRELEAADMENSAMFNRSLQHGLPPRARMMRLLKEQGLWTADDSTRIDELRRAVAKADNQIADLITKTEKITKVDGLDRPTPFTPDEQVILTNLETQRDEIVASRAVTFKDLRQLHIEVDAMFGHTADAKAEEAQRNCLMACVTEYVNVLGGAVTNVVGRVWGDIDALLDEPDAGLSQRIAYEYITYSNGVPSDWDADKTAAAVAEQPKQPDAPPADPVVAPVVATAPVVVEPAPAVIVPSPELPPV